MTKKADLNAANGNFVAREKISTSKKKPRFSLWYSSQYLNTMSSATIDPYFPMYVKSIGGNPLEIGLISGIFFLMNISQLFWAKFISQRKKYAKYAFWGRFLAAFLYIPIAFLRFGQILLLVVLRALQGLSTAFSVISESTYLAEILPKKERKRKLPNFTQIGLIGSLSGTLIAGFMFTTLSSQLKLSTNLLFFFILIWTSILGILSSLILKLGVTEYNPKFASVEPEDLLYHNITIPSKMPLLKKARLYLQRFQNFYLFALFAALLYFSITLASPFFIILEIEEYQLTFFDAAILTSVSMISQLLASIFLKKYKLLEIFGNRLIIFLSTILLSVSTILTILPLFSILPVTMPSLIIIWIILGLSWGSLNTAIMVFLFDIIHPKYRSSLIATYNIVTNITMFIGPTIGGLIILLSNTIASVFVFRALSILLVSTLLFAIKDPDIPGSLLFPIKRIFRRSIRTQASGNPQYSFVYTKYARIYEKTVSKLLKKKKMKKAQQKKQ